ncbi:MAG: hypothetical protein NVS1B2_09800 [Vulcanimicrobiaceae bacterium]
MIDQFAAFEDRQLQIEIAARNVVAACRSDRFGHGWRPKGIDEVAIVLESLGYSTDVIVDLWYDSLFAFAGDVAKLVDQYVTDLERVETRDMRWFVRSVRDYAQGALYSGPWIAAVIGLAVFGASLWSSLSTPLAIATSIALGSFGGLVASGTVSQMIGRRIAVHQLEDDPALVSYVLERILGVSTLAFLTIGIAAWLALRATYGDIGAALTGIFFFATALFEVSLAPLYSLRRFRSIALVSIVAISTTGLTFTLAFHRVVDVPTEPATLAAEVALVGAIVLIATMRWLRGKADADTRVKLRPAMRTIVRTTLPYGLFGALYFFTIVVDHLVAGVGPSGRYAYRAGYEFGCDIALVATIPAIGMINVAMESLPRRMLACAARGLDHIDIFDREMRDFYIRSAACVIGLTAIAVVLAELLGPRLLAHSVLGTHGNDDTEALFVLRYAAVAYGILMLGLFNTQLAFLMSRPIGPLGAAATAVLVNAVIASASRVAGLSPAFCVFGLVAGVVVFAALTTVSAYRVARDFTYHYYAGF